VLSWTDFFFVVVDRDLIEVLGFKDLVAVLAPDIINSISAHQKFRALVLATRHRKQIIPILMMDVTLSSPFFEEGRPKQP